MAAPPGRQDIANQFHYYRLSATTASCAAATTRSTTRARGQARATRTAARPMRGSRATSSRRSRNSRGSGSPTDGQGAIDTSTRFCAFFGSPARGRVAYAAGFTGLGVGAARFAADVMLDRLGGTRPSGRRLAMVDDARAVSSRALASTGIRSPDGRSIGPITGGAPQSAAEGARRARPRVRLMTSR